jgi:hypothetical protein
MMKNRLRSSVCALLLGCFFLTTFSVSAQSDKSRALTLDEYKKAKTLAIKDLDNDTYVKFENAYVLDRFEMKPPYVFKYSDGIERRVYLYRLLDNKTKQGMGMLAVYYTPGDGKKINVCIPSPESDKTVWAQYIDDLKDYNKAEAAFGSAFAYVMSREMSGMASGSTGGSTTGNKTDYDVCFPAQALVTLADGSAKPIAEIKAGQKVASYNAQTGNLEIAVVQEVQTHEGKAYAITTLLAANELVTASTTTQTAYIVALQATPNHPVLTQEGRKPMNQVKANDVLYVYNATSGAFDTFKVYAAQSAETVSKVYNLVTDKGNFLINGATVLDK